MSHRPAALPGLLGLLGLLAALATACAPAIIIRHEDPTRPKAQVFLDGQSVRDLALGETLKLKPAPGPHLIELTSPDGQTPWHPKGEGIRVLLDTEVILTLLPDAEPTR